MAAATATTNASKIAEEATKNFEENAERVKEFNSVVTETTKSNSRLVVDNYEKAAKSFFDAQRELAKSNQVDWIKDTSATQIQLAEDITSAWVKAARELLK